MAIWLMHGRRFLMTVSLLVLSASGAFSTEQKAGISVLPTDQTTGLSTNYSKVAVANLPIGQTVSMIQIANAPMLVGNNYAVSVYVTAHTEVPKASKDGFAPIPDAAWIAVEPSGLTLQAYATAKLDVKVTLPNDEKLFGKKYYCNILLITEGDPNVKGVRFGASITGRFMFSVAPIRNEEGLEAALHSPADAAFEIVPPVVVMKDVKPGQKIKIQTEAKKKVQLINQSKNQQQYWFSSVDPNGTNYILLDKSRFEGNVEDVLLNYDQIKLGPGKKKELDITIQVPANADLNRGFLAYLLSISSGASDKAGVNRYLAIYLKGTQASVEPKLENGASQGVTTSAEMKNK